MLTFERSVSILLVFDNIMSELYNDGFNKVFCLAVYLQAVRSCLEILLSVQDIHYCNDLDNASGLIASLNMY